MPEPTTLVLIGVGLWGFLQQSSRAVAPTPISTGASGTGPQAPLATPTGVLNQIPLGDVMHPQAPVIPVPSLTSILDNDTALTMRTYAHEHPEDFQAFLDKYADRLVLRQDLYMQAIKDPPTAGYQLTPTGIAALGGAAYKLTTGLNQLAQGQTADVFGIASSVAGQVPGVPPDLVTTLRGLTMGTQAARLGLQIADIATIATANNVSIVNVTGTMLQEGGLAPSLAAAPIQSMAGVLMAAGLCLDIGFTIIGDKPDVQKAIDVALDTASLVCLFIPVWGWIAVIVIQLVKFIIDIFGGDLFGGGLSHAEREAIETARYGDHLSPMFPQLSQAFTPRELFQRIVEWGSGYCGGKQVIAMAVNLRLKAGDQLTVGGQPYTVPADTLLGFGHQPCYWLASGEFAKITDDEQAWALARYGADNGVVAEAQAGISESLKVQFNQPTAALISARARTMKTLVEHHMTLDQIDQVALEYRMQPSLNQLARFYGWETWQAMMASIVEPDWHAWASQNTHGTLTDFAIANGYPTMAAFRASVFSSWQSFYDRLQALAAKFRVALGAATAGDPPAAVVKARVLTLHATMTGLGYTYDADRQLWLWKRAMTADDRLHALQQLPEDHVYAIWEYWDQSRRGPSWAAGMDKAWVVTRLSSGPGDAVWVKDWTTGASLAAIFDPIIEPMPVTVPPTADGHAWTPPVDVQALLVTLEAAPAPPPLVVSAPVSTAAATEIPSFGY